MPDDFPLQKAALRLVESLEAPLAIDAKDAAVDLANVIEGWFHEHRVEQARQRRALKEDLLAEVQGRLDRHRSDVAALIDRFRHREEHRAD